MNMNFDLLNRARYSAGILKDDKNGLGMLAKNDRYSADPRKKEHYEICKSLYFSTFMAALSEVPWTMGRRRGRLLKTRLPHGDSGFRFTYNLPYDCARPVQLSDNGPYVIDGEFLCTDTGGAELLYVSNGRGLPLDAVFERTSVSDYAAGKYDLVLSPGYLDEWDIPADFTVYMSIEDLRNNTPPARSDEDWEEYNPPRYEPKFYEYLEMMIAAKLAVNNTEQARLHDTLMQKAMLIKQEAERSTKSIAADKDKPSPWWGDRLGLSLDF